MIWKVILPGQPPSGNHANTIGRGFRRGGISYPKVVKTEEARAYAQAAGLITRNSKPREWSWRGGQVIVEYKFFLARDADCTNLIKTVEDAIFPAIGVNDRFALPRAMSKAIVRPAEARVEVTIRNANDHDHDHDPDPGGQQR